MTETPKDEKKPVVVSAILNDHGNQLSTYIMGPQGDRDKLPYKLVINAGREDGVRVGLNYLVYSLGDQIKDPFTGRILGKLEILRGKGEVVHVMEKMSIIRSTERARIAPVNNLATGLGFEGIAKDTEVPFRAPKIGDLARRVS